MTKRHKELLALLEKRTKELSDFLNERGDNITAEDLKQAHTIRDDVKRIRAEIEVCKEADGLRNEAAGAADYLNNPAGQHRHSGVVGSQQAGSTTLKREKGSKAFRMISQHGAGIFGKEQWAAISDPDYRRNFNTWFRGGRLSGAQFRNLEEGLDPQGGYLSPVEVIARLIEKKPTPTRLAQMVSTVNTARDRISLPRVNYDTASDDASGILYTTGFRVTNTDENPTSDTQSLVSDSNIFGTVSVPVYTFMIEGILTNNQIEDAMFDPMAWMTGRFVQTVELLRENKCINGSGNTEPSGILLSPGGTSSATTVGATSNTTQFPKLYASGNAASPYVTPDQIIGISESFPEQYEEAGRYFYQKTTTGTTIRQLKDNQGRYLFGYGYQDSGLVPGRQAMLNGRPVTHTQFWPAIGASANFLGYGDPEGYTLVNRIGFSVQVLREVAARRNQVIILGRVRFGGLLTEPWRFNVMQAAALA